MFDWVGLILKVVYYYGHIIGLSNFEFDWRNGRVFTACRSTVYAIAINVILVIILVLQLKETDLIMVFGRPNKILCYVSIISLGLRLTAGISAVFIRWSRRAKMMRFAKFMLRVFLKNPELRRISRWRILLKITVVIVTHLLQAAITWVGIKQSKDPQIILMVWQIWVSAIVKLAITQHYLITLSVQAHYHLLNMELRQVIDECRMLSFHPQRRGAFMTRCCSLADQVENMAMFQSQLQSIVNHLEKVFGIEGLILYGGYYLLSIATAYMIYSIFKNGHESLQLTFMSMIISFFLCFLFYMDIILDLINIFNLLDDHDTMIRQLEERTLFAHTLDVRLEQSFEIMQLQLIRNPLKIEMLKLFPISRSATTAVFGSLITNSIFLVQYDMENF